MQVGAEPGRIDRLVDRVRRRREPRQLGHELDHVAAHRLQRHRRPALVVAPPLPPALARPPRRDEPREDRAPGPELAQPDDLRQH